MPAGSFWLEHPTVVFAVVLELATETCEAIKRAFSAWLVQAAVTSTTVAGGIDV